MKWSAKRHLDVTSYTGRPVQHVTSVLSAAGEPREGECWREAEEELCREAEWAVGGGRKEGVGEWLLVTGRAARKKRRRLGRRAGGDVGR